jgi:hypothetical protein
LDGLRQPAVFNRKIEEEKAIRAVADQATTDAFEAIARSRKAVAAWFPDLLYANLRGTLASIADSVVTMTEELAKPNEQRAPAYQDAALDSTQFALFSPAPIYAEMEEEVLATCLAEALEHLGRGHPFVKAALGQRQPADVARRAVRDTRIGDVEFRRELVAGGAAAVANSDDPMIQLARAVQPITEAVGQRVQNELVSVETAAMEKIAKARFQAFGATVAPDATFTLRLSYGAVKSYELGTTLVPWKTTFFGLYERYASTDGKAPWELPPSFLTQRDRLDLSTPLNFVCTADIIGGNSGSPVLNRDAEIVGLIFDGNIQSLGNRFVYDEEVARAVAVHSAGILESLQRVYGAEELVGEIMAAR